MGRYRFLLPPAVWVGLGAVVFSVTAYVYVLHRRAAHRNLSAMYDKSLAYFKRGDPRLAEVALSIDDGPHVAFAPQILATLRKEGVHATFFVVGIKVNEHPEIVRQMLAEGNEVGNHSMTHPRLNTLTQDQVRHELSECEKAVFKASGLKMTLMRPPGERFTHDVLQTAKQMGFITVAANIGVKDYIIEGDHTWERDNPKYPDHVKDVFRNTLKQLKNGAIIDLHDMPTTADALDDIIKAIQQRGYKILTVSELLNHLPKTPDSQPAVSPKK